ncbi:MAG TPA: hypothetical protein VML19_35670 [Verrucomicrobiae bacterium]|nr:hypothetical protein [Verrucomicrobiae bacterium]
MQIARLLALSALSAIGYAQQLRPGVWAAADPGTLPLPVSGYQVYLVGELHGVKENAAIFGQYLSKLNGSAGLRDVAIEEKSIYEREAQEYIAGRSGIVPAQLCLRANILDEVRRLNDGRAVDQQIRIHLVDIDSPADAIRQHLLMLKERIAGGRDLRIPETSDLKSSGLETVENLKRLQGSGPYAAELRTIAHSIRAYQQGLEFGLGPPKGSPYLDDREDAVAENIRDMLAAPDCHGVVALYGDDHIGKVRRKDGGPDRNLSFAPMALRLQESGVKVFSLATFPLTGRYAWRGMEAETIWSAADGSLANGETLDKLLAKAHEPALLYFDAKQERVKIPSDDINRSQPDAFLLIRVATPMENRCAVR